MKNCKKCGTDFFCRDREGSISLNKRKYCSRKCVYASSTAKTHGFSIKIKKKTRRFYNIWFQVKGRCFNTNSPAFRFYGERGIKNQWNSFEEFRDDMYEGYLKHIKEFGEKQTTIDRIDNDGNYCKENCRWATMQMQQQNRGNNRMITHNGKTRCVSEWSEYTGIKICTLFKRLDYGWSNERTITTPVRYRS